MKRNELLGLAVAALGAIAGCGDNSDECGPGTTDMSGVCTATAPTCGDGTILNATTGSCDIDPSACQDGTVLINNKCQDPTAGLTIDLEEGAEPNGLNIGEASNTPAGVISALKPIGDPNGFVIHGHITPFQDINGDGQNDPDFDTYTLTVTAPTLLEVTSAGVGGLAAAFIVEGDASGQLATYRRFGMNLSGDTSLRKIYLPIGGTYDLTIGDTRSMNLDSASPPAAGIGGAAGGPNAEYYVTINQIAIPAPTALTVTSGVASDSGSAMTGLGLDDIKFYTVAMGVGLNDIQFAMPASSGSPSITIAVNSALKNFADGTIADQFGDPAVPAELLLAGLASTDTTLIVGDFNWNYGPGPATYQLTVTTGDAQQLPSDGTSTTPVTEISAAPTSFFDLNAYFFDVTDTDATMGMGLSFNHPVDMAVFDTNLQIVSLFTWDAAQGAPVGNTAPGYPGLLRIANPGRYYLLAYDPNGTAGTDTLIATSTVVELTPTPITEGTVLAAQPITTVYNSAPFEYSSGTDPWQQFNVTGTATGNINVAFFNPATAFGRLDDLAITLAGAATATVTPGDVAPLTSDDTAPFAHTFLATSTTPFGRILLDDGTTDYFVKVNPTTTTGTRTVSLDFRIRAGLPHGDFGTKNTGDTGTLTNESITIAAPSSIYIVESSAGNRVSVSATPNASPTMNGKVVILRNDESIEDSVNNGAVGAADSTTAIAVGAGWTAFAVQSQIVLTGTVHYDVALGVAAPETYTLTTGAVAFTDACTGAGSSTITLNDAGFGDPADEGYSNPINAPANFTFFGVPAPQFVISSNGFLTFDTGFATTSFANTDLPSQSLPTGLISPYWDDLDQVTVCVKTTGTKMVIEWAGVLCEASIFGCGGTTQVEAEAVIDGATNTIVFAYGPNQQATGDTDGGASPGAAIGIEDQSGTQANKIGFEMAVVTANSSNVFTPN